MSDLISRQDAIETLKGFDVEIIPYEHGKMYVQETLNAIYHRINNIPSAESERTAKVIDKSVGRHSISDFDWTGKCEKCGNEIQFSFDYCPYCGSRLEWE